MDEEMKRLPKGLRNFVDKSIDLLDITTLYNNYAKNGGITNGTGPFIHLIECFLNLQMVFNKDLVPDNYKNVKYVKDLPEEDIKNCIYYIQYILGVSTHTGGSDFFKMYKRHIKR